MDDLTIETFAPHLDSEFRLEAPPPDGSIVLRLTEVTALGHQPNAPRVEPFSLQFSGPPQPFLEQRMYRIEHDALGALDIFLVPIGYDRAGSIRYEAVFN